MKGSGSSSVFPSFLYDQRRNDETAVSAYRSADLELPITKPLLWVGMQFLTAHLQVARSISPLAELVAHCCAFLRCRTRKKGVLRGSA